MLPRDAAPAAIRRLDYRPPAFLVDTVDLTFDLAPEATRVSATLAFRRNPGAAAVDREAPLVLNGEGLVLPELKDIQKVSRAIAFAVGKMAQQQGVAVKTSAEALQQAIDDNFWQAEYRDYRRTSI